MLNRRSRKARNSRTTHRVRPRIDGLEDRFLLATFKVNTTLDTVAVNLKTGQDATGRISLRSAIQAANAKPNADTIVVPAGTYQLTLTGANEDNDATGDLDINSNVTIKGKGSSSTIVDANNIDRAFQILSGKVQISGLTIEHGRADKGGGILNSGGKVTLTSDVFLNNVAVGSNGSNGRNALGDVSVGGDGGNGNDGGNAIGGGIANQAGTMTVSKIAIIGNLAQGGDGGVGGTGGFGTTTALFPGGSGATAQGGRGGAGGSGGTAFGGGIFNAANLTLTATTFSANVAAGGVGGLGGLWS